MPKTKVNTAREIAMTTIQNLNGEDLEEDLDTLSEVVALLTESMGQMALTLIKASKKK